MRRLVLLLGLFVSLAGAKPVNVNTADADTIADALNGVGPQKARTIVEYREAKGRFNRLQDLDAVPGIGEKTLKRIENDVLFEDEAHHPQPARAVELTLPHETTPKPTLYSWLEHHLMVITLIIAAVGLLLVAFALWFKHRKPTQT